MLNGCVPYGPCDTMRDTVEEMDRQIMPPDSETPRPVGTMVRLKSAQVSPEDVNVVDSRDSGGLFGKGNTVGALSNFKDETILMAECEDLARRVIREGGNYTMTSLAKEMGMTTHRLKTILASPQYRDIYAKTSEAFYGSIDEHIKDERMDSLIRSNAIQARGMTVLGEILDVVQKHTKDVLGGGVMPKATLIKAGVDAVAEARQTSAQMAGRATGQGASTINFNINGKHASLIQGALRESGVNLNDVLEGYIDAEVVPQDASK